MRREGAGGDLLGAARDWLGPDHGKPTRLQQAWGGYIIKALEPFGDDEVEQLRVAVAARASLERGSDGESF